MTVLLLAVEDTADRSGDEVLGFLLVAVDKISWAYHCCW